MTIKEAINQVDLLKPNTYEALVKIGWLSRLDTMVKGQVIDAYDGAEKVQFSGYDEQTPKDTALLMPEPYAEAYLRWIEAQIDYANGEYDKYNNSIVMFNTAFQGYKDEYNRTHLPKSGCSQFF